MIPIFFVTALPVRSCVEAAVSANAVVDDSVSYTSFARKLVRWVQLQYATPFTSSVFQYVQPELLQDKDAASHHIQLDTGFMTGHV